MCAQICASLEKRSEEIWHTPFVPAFPETDCGDRKIRGGMFRESPVSLAKKASGAAEFW
jgi:histidinol phosphatase-like enzyme